MDIFKIAVNALSSDIGIIIVVVFFVLLITIISLLRKTITLNQEQSYSFLKMIFIGLILIVLLFLYISNTGMFNYSNKSNRIKSNSSEIIFSPEHSIINENTITDKVQGTSTSVNHESNTNINHLSANKLIEKTNVDTRKPVWCYTNEKSIEKFVIDEYFICMNALIWEHENRFVYEFKRVNRKSNRDTKKELSLFLNGWLKTRRYTCVSSVKQCVKSYKNILNKLLFSFDEN